MKAIQELSGSLDGYESKHYHSIISLTDKECSKRVSLPKGIYAQREHDNIAIVKIRPKPKLTVPVDLDAGVVLVRDYKLSLRVEKKYDLRESRGNREVFDICGLELPLYVRNRKLGDVVETKIGNKKAKKIFSECRIAQRERDSIPMLCDQRGILWVIGVARAYRGFVNEQTKKYLVVDFERLD
jgi:tRNA(Ile)-lysidine synthase